MFRTLMTHLYVILMALLVVTAGNIIADRYGAAIASSIERMFGQADSGLQQMEESVKDWNRKMLD